MASSVTPLPHVGSVPNASGLLQSSQQAPATKSCRIVLPEAETRQHFLQRNAFCHRCPSSLRSFREIYFVPFCLGLFFVDCGPAMDRHDNGDSAPCGEVAPSLFRHRICLQIVDMQPMLVSLMQGLSWHYLDSVQKDASRAGHKLLSGCIQHKGYLIIVTVSVESIVSFRRLYGFYFHQRGPPKEFFHTRTFDDT